MKKPIILRKRYIPDETVDISRDELLYRDESLLITKWKAIKARPDIGWGISFAFLNDGYKIARFYDNSGNFIYWYCDIIDVWYDSGSDTYTLVDLLLDIKLMPDGKIKVLDADELAEALENKMITTEQACRALRTLNKLLGMEYEGNFPPGICMDTKY